MDDNRTVVLRVQLDEADTEKKLGQLTLDLEATRKAQAALTAERKAGKKSDEDFAAESVKLKSQLAAQRGEYAALEKNLSLYRKAQNGEASSYQATQAALSLAIRQQAELAGSADNSSEASQALTRQIEQYRATLKATDEQQGAFFRNIGNYPKGESLQSLVQQLVRLQEETKDLTAGTEQAVKAQMRIVGFQQATAQAGAKEGKTFEETTNFIQGYGAAIRPATAALVQLEAEQQAAAESGQATGEAARQIGFRMGQARKAIDDTTKALKAEATQAKASTGTTKGLGGALLEAAGSNDLLGGVLDKVKAAQEAYSKAQEVAKLATEESTGALGGLKAALISTGIGALVVLLGTVAAFLTRTQAGSDLLNRKMAGLRAVTTLAGNAFEDLGEKAIKALQNPSQAATDLGNTIKDNLSNRVKAFGVLWDAIRNKDGGKLVDAYIQLQTGVEGATGKLRGLLRVGGEALKQGEALGDMRNKLNRAENDNITTNKTLLNLVERQKNIRDNEFNSIGVRKAANEEAYRLEMKREATLVQLAERRVAVAKEELRQAGGRTRDEEKYKALQEAENELSDIREDAAGKQNELITNRYQLEQEALDKDLEVKAQAFALYTSQLDQQMAQVKKNSDEELSLLQQKLRLERDAELNMKNLTLAQKLKADTDYENKSLALTLDFQRRRLLAVLQAQADNTAAQIAGQQAGSAELLRLQTEQVENQRLAALAALDQNTDNTAATERINAQAAQQRRQLEFADAARLLQEHLDSKRRAVDLDHAQGLTDEAAYQERLAAINRAGLAQQALINADYNQSNTATDKATGEQQVADAQRVSDIKRTIQENTFQAIATTTDLIIEQFGKESAAGEAALAIKKVLAVAEIAINLEKQLSLNATTGAAISGSFPPYSVPLGVAYEIAADALAIASAATAAANILKLQQGGIAHGPSHEQGGIPLYHRGRPAGIEIEGGEAVISATATRMYLPLLSAINQAGGGRSLLGPQATPMYAALGAITRPVALAQLRGDSDLANHFRALGRQIEGIKIYTRTSDTKAALGRDAQTAEYTNS